ncbi:MAG: ribose 5-phosphate isomerase B [bacterium]|nr:ribose 5-phosphate isomerase B [bacterium]
MRIAIGADHGGFELKQKIISALSKKPELELSDFGTYSTDAVDYPDIAFMVATEVARKSYDFGILIDGIGVGSAIAANKVKGILAATCNEVTTAKSARAHDNANIIVLGSGIVGLNLAIEIINTFLKTGFEGGRHERRLNTIFNYENANSKVDLERYS